MKLRRFILLLSVFFLLLSSSFALTATIFYSGKVTHSSKRFAGPFNGVSILVKADGKQIASCSVDSTNSYELFFTDLGQKQFEFYIADLADTLLMQTVQPTFEDNVLDFSFPKTYQLENKKAICPICHHADQTEEILYGDGMPGGCIISFLSPHWFCKRDKAKF